MLSYAPTRVVLYGVALTERGLLLQLRRSFVLTERGLVLQLRRNFVLTERGLVLQGAVMHPSDDKDAGPETGMISIQVRTSLRALYRSLFRYRSTGTDVCTSGTEQPA